MASELSSADMAQLHAILADSFANKYLHAIVRAILHLLRRNAPAEQSGNTAMVDAAEALTQQLHDLRQHNYSVTQALLKVMDERDTLKYGHPCPAVPPDEQAAQWTPQVGERVRNTQDGDVGTVMKLCDGTGKIPQ